MKAKKYSEEQIIGALQEVDKGSKVEDVCRRMGVSKVTFYRWKAKFSGMQVSDAKRLRLLEEENRRLKHMVADQALDIQALKAVVRRKW
jgi:putative transposase